MLQSVAEFFRVLQSVAECYRVLQSITEYYRVFLAHLLGPISGLVLLDLLQSSAYITHACFRDSEIGCIMGEPFQLVQFNDYAAFHHPPPPWPLALYNTAIY